MSDIKFPLTAAAAQQAENFEAVNEGIWVTEAALTNIEATLAAHASQVAELTGSNETVSGQLATATADLATANQTIADRDATITQLQADLAEAKKQPAADFQNTSREKDEQGAVKKPVHLSDDEPSNALADSLLGKPAPKK